jgi:hypothetical protein
LGSLVGDVKKVNTADHVSPLSPPLFIFLSSQHFLLRLRLRLMMSIAQPLKLNNDAPGKSEKYRLVWFAMSPTYYYYMDSSALLPLLRLLFPE